MEFFLKEVDHLEINLPAKLMSVSGPKKTMGVIPAGKLGNGVSLTAVEAAVLSSISVWARINTSWYKTTYVLKIVRNASLVACLIFIFLKPIVVLITAVLSFFIHMYLVRLKPTPVKVPRIGATLHQAVWYGNIPHLVTANQAYQTTISARGPLPTRALHIPSDFPPQTPWQQGDKEFYLLSTTSFDALIDFDSRSIQKMNDLQMIDVPLRILTGHNAGIIGKICSGFSDSHVGEDMTRIAQCFDMEAKIQTEERINWFLETSAYNDTILNSLIPAMQIDISQYDNWRVHLKSRGSYFHTMAFDSTIFGWGRAGLGLFAAEKSLEKSVAADIIAQEEAVYREMEQTEAKMREKSSDYQLVIAENSEKLSRRISEFNGMISAQTTTLSKLNSIHVPQHLKLESKYAITVGGGGHVGPKGGNVSSVSSTVGSYVYSIPNPAAPTVYGLIEMAAGELNRYQNMKKAVEIEISELSGAFNRRTGQMKSQQEKRLEELNVAKERAIHAIRKDSREVNSIAQQNYPEGATPWDILAQRSKGIWNQPHEILNERTTHYHNIMEQAREFILRVKESIGQTTVVLTTPTLAGLSPSQTITHHWVFINGKPHSEVLQMGLVQFNNQDPIQREEGESLFVLGLDNKKLISHEIDKNRIFECLRFLYTNGAIDLKVFKTIMACKNSQLLLKEIS